MNDLKKDLISGAIFLVLGIVVCISASLIQDPEISMVGPRVFPYFIGICMIVLSLVLLIQTGIKYKTAEIKEEKPQQTLAADKNSGRDELRALMIAAICLFYAVLFSVIGYFASTFLSIIAIGVLLKEKRWYAYVILFAVAIVIWAGFTFLLRINLP